MNLLKSFNLLGVFPNKNRVKIKQATQMFVSEVFGHKQSSSIIQVHIWPLF